MLHRDGSTTADCQQHPEMPYLTSSSRTIATQRPVAPQPYSQTVLQRPGTIRHVAGKQGGDMQIDNNILQYAMIDYNMYRISDTRTHDDPFYYIILQFYHIYLTVILTLLARSVKKRRTKAQLPGRFLDNRVHQLSFPWKQAVNDLHTVDDINPASPYGP